MNNLKCDGNCEEYSGHKGEVKPVLVSYKEPNGIKPFSFNYCENAIQEDIERGFEVTIENEEDERKLNN